MTELDAARAAAYLLEGEEAAARLFKRTEVGICPRCGGSGYDPKAYTFSPALHMWISAECELCEGTKAVARDRRARSRWALLPTRHWHASHG